MLTARIERGQKTNRVHVTQRRPRKCCAGVWGDPHLAGCIAGLGGRGNGKSGKRRPVDRGRDSPAPSGVTIQVCVSMFESELDRLDALAMRLKVNRSNVVRMAIDALIKGGS